MVSVPVVVVFTGSNLAVIPVGAPVTVNSTSPLKSPVRVMVIF